MPVLSVPYQKPGPGPAALAVLACRAASAAAGPGAAGRTAAGRAAAVLLAGVTGRRAGAWAAAGSAAQAVRPRMLRAARAGPAQPRRMCPARLLLMFPPRARVLVQQLNPDLRERAARR